jgi:chromosome segregation ATPase
MDNINLQAKFKSLTDNLNSLELEKAKLETQLDSILEQKENAFNEIKSLAKVENLEEAEDKLKKLKARLEQLATEAETLLNE